MLFYFNWAKCYEASLKFQFSCRGKQLEAEVIVKCLATENNYGSPCFFSILFCSNSVRLQ